MAVQINTVLQRGHFNVCNSDLLSPGSKKTPQALGLKPIQQYGYLNYVKNPEDAETVAENIREAQQNPNMYYYSDENPFIVEYCQGEQYVWKCVDACDDSTDVFYLGAYLIDKHDQSIHLNAGSHGTPLGIMVSDLFTLERHAIPQLALNQHVFNQEDLERVHGKSSLNPVTTQNRPTYPPLANHNIYTWCFSFSTMFTKQSRYLTPLDNKGRHIPSIFKCVASQKPLTVPLYHPGCREIEGHRHYYDLTTARGIVIQNNGRLDSCFQMPSRLNALAKAKKAYHDCFKKPSELIHEGLLTQEAEDYRYKFYCRLEGCPNIIDLRKLDRDPMFEISLNGYKETTAKVQGMIENRDQRIELVEAENSKLKGQLTTLTADRDFSNQQVNRLLEVVDQQREVIYQQNQVHGIPIPEVLEQFNPSRLLEDLQAFILQNPIIYADANESWVDNLRPERNRARKAIQVFFCGSGMYRSNAFIVNSFLQENKHHQILETLFISPEAKKAAVKLAFSDMNKNAEKYDEFLWDKEVARELFYPLMTMLIDGGFILNQLNVVAEKYDRSIRLPKNGWQEKEQNRYQPKTYEESVKSLASSLLRLELSQSIISILKNRPNTQIQQGIAEQRVREGWQKERKLQFKRQVFAGVLLGTAGLLSKVKV